MSSRRVSAPSDEVHVVVPVIKDGFRKNVKNSEYFHVCGLQPLGRERNAESRCAADTEH